MGGSDDASSLLRDPSSNRQWYIVPLIVLVFYVYSCEIKKRRWRRVYLAIGFFFGELIVEIINALIGKFFGNPLWACSSDTAFMITVGYTIEIAFFFALCPFILFNFVDGIEKSRHNIEIPGIKYKVNWARFLLVCGLGVTSAGVEVCLNLYGLLIWEYWWWNKYFPILQVLIYTISMLVTVECYNKMTNYNHVFTVSMIITVCSIVIFITFIFLGLI